MAAAKAEDNQVASAGFTGEQHGNQLTTLQWLEPANNSAEDSGDQPTTQPLLTANNSAEDSGAGGGSPSGDEELPGLNRWLECLKILRHKEVINAWIIENGACDLDDIVENLDDLTDAISEFTHIEKKRIHENAKAAADKARQ